MNDIEAKSSQPLEEADRLILDGGEDSPLASTRDEKPGAIGLRSEAVEITKSIIAKEDGETSNEVLPDQEVSNEGDSPISAARVPVPTDEKRLSPAFDNQMNRKRGHSVETKDEGRRSKKHRSDSPPQSTDKACQESGLDSDLWDALKVPRQVDRKRRDSTGSRGSMRSSVSSKSSDLNSLEAELLGRSVKQKEAEPSPASRQRQDHKAPLKAKRRQQNANSAYRLDPSIFSSIPRVRLTVSLAAAGNDPPCIAAASNFGTPRQAACSLPTCVDPLSSINLADVRRV